VTAVNNIRRDRYEIENNYSRSAVCTKMWHTARRQKHNRRGVLSNAWKQQNTSYKSDIHRDVCDKHVGALYFRYVAHSEIEKSFSPVAARTEFPLTLKNSQLTN